MKKAGWFLALLVTATALAGASLGMSLWERKDVKTPSPSLEVRGASWEDHWESGFEAVYDTLLKNLHGPNPFFENRYAYPSPTFRGVYLWDTAFTSQVWKIWDVNTAQEINRTVMNAAAEGGRLPHFHGLYSSSDYTQPPVMTWSVWQNYLWSGDRAYLSRAYPVLKRYNEWLYQERRHESGLFCWLHPYESGIDNSPRFGSADESKVADMDNLAAVDLNSYLVLQNRILARMASELGHPDEEQIHQRRALEQKRLMNQKLWDPDTGLYYDRDMNADELVRIKTIASLFPMFAMVPDKTKAGRMLEHLMDPKEFNTAIPLPSVARDDPRFEKDCWRGPVWINTAYMAVIGMENYGFYKEASLISFKLVNAVYKVHENTGDLVEFYDPDRFDFKKLHRKKGNLYKQITLGGKPRPNFVGWTGLVNTLVVEHLVGYRKVPGETWLQPRFPEQAAGAKLVVRIPADELVIKIEVKDQGRTAGEIIKQGETQSFELAFNQKLMIRQTRNK
ncbi:MAG: trehalase family glycosidase [bacterium]